MIKLLFQGKEIPLDSALYSKPKITEELNGKYSLELYIAITKPEIKTGPILASPKRKAGRYKAGEIRNDVEVITKAEMIQKEMIIYADGNIFRIKERRKTSNAVYVYAKQIFFADFADNFLENVRPENLNGAGALNWMATRTQFSHSFTFLSDIATTGTAYYVRKKALEAIMTADNSFLSVWGGEIEADNYTIKINQTRGADRGVVIAYGKNILGFEEELKTEGVYTRIIPTGRDEENNVVMLPEKYIDSKYVNSYDNPKVLHQDYPDIKVDSENNITLEDVYAQLRNNVQALYDSGIDMPFYNYTVSFKELSNTEEYKNFAVLVRTYLGDTVTINHSKLKMKLKARVIKTIKEYNAAKKTWEYKEIELGQFKPNYISKSNQAITEIRQTIDLNKTELQKAIEYATDKLAGNKGGYVYFKRNANGEPEEIFIMDTPDPNTAEQCLRINKEGIGGSTTGINGPFSLGLLIDGTINATMIVTGLMSASLIKGGTLLLGGESNGNGSFQLVDALNYLLATMDNDGIKSYDNGGKLGFKIKGAALDFYDWWVTGNNKIGSIYASGSSLPDSTKGLEFNINSSNANYMSFSGASTMFDIDLRRTEKVQFHTDVKFNSPIHSNGNLIMNGWIYGVGTGSIWMMSPVNMDSNLGVNGDFMVYGDKNCIQQTEHYGERKINAYETAEYYFGDIGRATIADGICYITFDDIFLETVNTDVQYEVKTWAYGNGNVWVEPSEMYSNYFIVRGSSDIQFGFEIMAKRKGWESVRLEVSETKKVINIGDTQEQDYVVSTMTNDLIGLNKEEENLYNEVYGGIL